LSFETVAFYALGALAIGASLGVIGQRNPIYSVMSLIGSFGALAGLYILLDSPFTAVTQIIVYAGAIMVLFLFVVMLLNAHTEDEVIPARLGPHAMKLGALLSVLLAIEIAWGLSKISLAAFGDDPGVISKISSVTTIGQALFTTHSFAFEVTSILILVAMVGAVVIAGPRREP
jgi:NADH-quinone oxidoreductase subunit J